MLEDRDLAGCRTNTPVHHGNLPNENVRVPQVAMALLVKGFV
jgi:hypothetical protein